MATMERTPTGAEPSINDFQFEAPKAAPIVQSEEPAPVEAPVASPSNVSSAAAADFETSTVKPAASPVYQQAARPSSSPKASPTAAAAPVTKHVPNIMAAFAPIKQKIDRGLAGSRFAFVRRPAVAALSWSNPLLSATLTLGVVTFFVAHVWLAQSLLSLGLHALLAFLAASGALHLYKAFAGPEAVARLPFDLDVRIPVNRAALVTYANRVADGIADGVEAVNRALSWSDVPASMRVLAYAWLAARWAFLASPSWLLTGFFLFSLAVPAYLLNQPIIDRAYTAKVAPLVTQVANTVSAQLDSLSASFNNMNGGILAAAGGALFLYVFWSLISIPSLITTASFGLLAYDWMRASATTTPRVAQAGVTSSPVSEHTD